jgi:hypothetical protein
MEPVPEKCFSLRVVSAQTPLLSYNRPATVYTVLTFVILFCSISYFRRNLDYQDVLAKLAENGIAIRVASPKLVMEEVSRLFFAMRPDAFCFIMLLCLTPDDFTRQGRLLPHIGLRLHLIIIITLFLTRINR